MNANSCPTCLQRELEQALRDRDFTKMKRVMCELTRASLTHFRRDTEQRIDILLRGES